MPTGGADMKNVAGRRLLITALAVAGLASCMQRNHAVLVQAEVAGQPIVTSVDSEIAKYYLEQYVRGRRARPQLDESIASLERSIGTAIPSRVALRDVAKRHSLDLAALMLWHSLSSSLQNRFGAETFREEFSRLKVAPSRLAAAAARGTSPVMIAFAPGWLYRSQRGNGADFAGPRQILEQSGARTNLLDTDENGTVENNAHIIAEQLGTLSRADTPIVVVSASKAGPEVAQALSELRSRHPNHRVKAWVNIGGILRGTPLADRAVAWPWCWFVKLFVLHGHSFDGIRSMATSGSAPRDDRGAIPPDIVVVNYVGIPLSGQVTHRAKLGYVLLREEGPNDGIAPIVDELVPTGITIAELGLDHFFTDPDIDTKTIALSRTVIRLVSERETLLTDAFEASTSGRPPR